MPEETKDEETLAVSETQTQAVENEKADEADTQAVDSDKEKEELVPKSKLVKTQNEAKNLRERLKKYEEAETSSLPELERVQKKLADVTKERDTLHEQIRSSQIQVAASKHGALYPDAVARLIASDEEDVEQAVKDIRKQYPAMFRTQSADGGANTQAAPTSDMNLALRRAVGR